MACITVNGNCSYYTFVTRSCLLHGSFEDGLTRREVIAHNVLTKKRKEIVERASQLDVVVSNRLARSEPRRQVEKKKYYLLELRSLFSSILFWRDSTHAPPEEEKFSVRSSRKKRESLRFDRIVLEMATGAVSPMAAKQAERLKEDGNNCFKKERFGAAIDAYTEAITLSPKVPVYWTNRALCHMKRKDWTRVEEDCRKAIQLDHDSVKAHYMLGLALLQKEEYADGVKALQRALDFGRGANPTGYMVEEIWEELSKAKYMEWELLSAGRSWELNSLKETCVAALNQQRALDMSRTEESSEEDYSSHTDQLKALDRVFEKAAEEDKPTEVPDYLCCNITLEIFRDPVISPSGVTYERAAILEHINKVGKFDPITREELDPSKLVSNLAIKEAVAAYLEKHVWAYKTGC
uniref:E3 ubiquitin-protein ligase CHIP n=2 Tax=Brassica oleracea var. oleracea TaxID=109376 RepID=A0A0D3CM24_BRAOL